MGSKEVAVDLTGVGCCGRGKEFVLDVTDVRRRLVTVGTAGRLVWGGSPFHKDVQPGLRVTRLMATYIAADEVPELLTHADPLPLTNLLKLPHDRLKLFPIIKLEGRVDFSSSRYHHRVHPLSLYGYPYTENTD